MPVTARPRRPADNGDNSSTVSSAPSRSSPITRWTSDGRGQDAEVSGSSRMGRRSALRTGLLVAALLLSACSGGGGSAPTGAATSPLSSPRPVTSPSRTLGVGPLVSVTDTTAGAPTFPAAVSLAWLDGVSQEPAVRLPGNGLVRWQGSRPGAAAEILPDGAYRWVGPDGSMVGCGPHPKVGRAACIGVDPAGDTAVTGGTSAVRVVYGPGGDWLGDFEVGGDHTAGARPTRTRDEAVRSTGVDMGALVDFVTRRAPFAGGVTGDPHLITAGGIRVTSQQLGDFDARTGDPAHQVQIRTEAMPYRTDVAEVTAVVVGASGHRIEFRRTGELLVGGVQIVTRGSFRQIDVPGGVVVGWWPPGPDGVVDVVVRWPGGETVSMAADSALGMTVVDHLPTAAVGGLFGTEQAGPMAAPVVASTAPEVPDPAATGSRGDFVARATSSAVLTTDAIVQSWRVRVGESMFADVPPAPVPQAAGPAIGAAASLAAEKYCAAAEMTNTSDIASCVFDVARTGDSGYVEYHGELAASAEQPAFPAAIAAHWPALQLGTVGTPVGLELGTQVDTSVPAGGRRVYLLDVTSAAGLSIRAAPCPGGGRGDEAASDAAALRVFDGGGHPVSARRSNCGRGQTDVLAAGSYYLVLAGPNAGPAANFKLRVSPN